MKEIMIYTNYSGSRYFDSHTPYPCIPGSQGIDAKVRTKQGLWVTVIIKEGVGCPYIDNHQWHVIKPSEIYDCMIGVRLLRIKKFSFKELPFIHWLLNR